MLIHKSLYVQPMFFNTKIGKKEKNNKTNEITKNIIIQSPIRGLGLV